MASKSSKQILNEIKKHINAVDGTLNEISKTTANINGGVELLTPDAVALKDKSNTEEAHKGLEMKLQGNDKKDAGSIQRSVERKIEDKYKQISYYTSGGMYKQLFLAKQNRYMKQEFPDLDKALRLFNTDVCFGSYFSAHDNTNNLFRIKKDGVVVDDSNIIDTITEIINPSASKKEDINYRSFDDLDFEASLTSRMDGYSFIRLVPTKKILTDLYVKYIMKKVKSKAVASQNKTTKAASLESLKHINNYLSDIGFEHTIPDISYNLATLPSHLLDAIPKALLQETVESTNNSPYPLNDNNEARMPDGFEEFEHFVYANESFEEFSYRMLTGKSCTTAIYANPSTEDENKRHVYTIGFESGSLDTDTAYNIYNEFFLNENNVSDLDNLEIGLESAFSRLNIFDQNILHKMTFEEIYSIDTSKIINKLKGNIFINITHAVESATGMTNLKKPKLTMQPIEQVIKNIIIADNGPIAGIENEVMRQFEEFKTKTPGLEASATFRSTLNDNPVDRFTFNGNSSTVDNANAIYESSMASALKIFDHIKGCSSVLLDNRRAIPLMMGNKNIGALYIDKTHAEVEHLLATRSVISNPIAGADTMSLFQIDEERKEETLGRLVFTDTIKPIFERNVSTKFLRENADLMYTIKELLEENEISKTDRSYGAFSDMGYFNLSKVSFIPSSELIMYSNGDGLGESVFEKAFVPANAYILARESYISWLLVDGKGMCFVMYPKGLNETNGAYGANPLAEQLQDSMMTRMSLKMSATDNMRLTRPIITLPIDENAQADKIEVKDVKPPEFDIDHDTITRWKEEATSLVGYPASSFTDLNSGGARPELKAKLESVDASIVLDIIAAQDKKVHSSNSLATKLLHYRGGKEYESYTVEWLPPRPSRSSSNIKKEVVTEKKEVLESYADMFNLLFDGREDWNEVKPFLINVLKDKMFSDDKYVKESENMYLTAQNKMKTYLSSIAQETK